MCFLEKRRTKGDIKLLSMTKYAVAIRTRDMTVQSTVHSGHCLQSPVGRKIKNNCSKESIKTSFLSEECVCLGGNKHPVQICCRRKARGKMARNQHSFSSGAQPTQAQIDPSWIAEKGWVVRRGEPGENGLLLFCVAFKSPLPFQSHFLVHIIYMTDGFKELSCTLCTHYTQSIHSHSSTMALFTILIGLFSQIAKAKKEEIRLPVNTQSSNKQNNMY